MPLPSFLRGRRLSVETNTTHVNDHDQEHTRLPGETTGGSALYPATQREEVEAIGGAHTPTAFGDKSPGVRRIEIIGQFFTGWHKVLLFLFIFLVSCKSSSHVNARSRDEVLLTDSQMYTGTKTFFLRGHTRLIATDDQT